MPEPPGEQNFIVFITNTEHAVQCSANKTLLDQKVKTDPPPQHKRLGGTAPKKLDDGNLGYPFHKL
jgi:hypothetical protein